MPSNSRFRRAVRRGAKYVGTKIKQGAQMAGTAIKAAARKRYVEPGFVRGGLQLARDVAVLKHLVNAEKKRYEIISPNSERVGQVDNLLSGHDVIDISPYVSQGVTATTRNGASIKLTSSYYQFQFWQQGGTNHPSKLTMYLLHTTDADMTINDVAPRFFLPNRWIQQYNGGVLVYDYQSARNMDHYKNFRVLNKREFVITGDSISGQTQMLTVKMPIMYNKGKGLHFRYDTNSNVLTSGKLFILIVADSGNADPLVNSTLSGLPVSVANSGVNFNFSALHYFVDN